MLRVKHSQTENSQQEKIAEILKLLQLGFMERRIAENYLRGEHGEVALKGLRRRDMEQEPKSLRETLYGILDDYYAQEQHREADRFFRLLYALYGASLAHCVVTAYSSFWNALRKGDIQVDMSAALTVYARKWFPGYIMRHRDRL